MRTHEGKARTDLERQRREMAHAFDSAFRVPPRTHHTSKRRFVAIRSGERALAIDLEEVAGLGAGQRVLRLPGAPEWVGLTGLRGRLVTVHSLARILSTGGDRGAERWMVLCRADPSVGLAFDEFEGILEVSEGDVDAIAEERPGDPIRAITHHGAVTRSVIGVEPILALAVRPRR